MNLLVFSGIIALATAALPPGYEDELYCAKNTCLTEKKNRPGFTGPQRMFWQCMSPDGTMTPVTTWGFKMQTAADKAELLSAGHHTNPCSSAAKNQKNKKNKKTNKKRRNPKVPSRWATNLLAKACGSQAKDCGLPAVSTQKRKTAVACLQKLERNNVSSKCKRYMFATGAWKKSKKNKNKKEKSAPEGPMLLITEVAGKGSEGTCADSDWIEIHNSALTPVSLEGLQICDKKKCSVLPDAFVAGGAYVVLCGSSKEFEGAFSFGIAKDDEVTLKTADDIVIHTTQLGGDKGEPGVTWARQSDGTFSYTVKPSPSKPNYDGR